MGRKLSEKETDKRIKDCEKGLYKSILHLAKDVTEHRGQYFKVV